MKRLAVLSLAAVLILGLTTGAWAIPFPITDVRALGMGGAFVAAGEGIGAVNYNPALLGKDSTVGVVLPEFTARVEDHIGMVDLIDDLNNAYDVFDTTTVISILNTLDEGGATDIMAYGGIGAGFGIFGISGGVTYADLIYGTVYPDNIYTTQDSGFVDPSNNTLEFRGIEAKQIILSAAASVGDILVGANVRTIDATVYSDSEWLLSDPDIGVGDVTTGTETDKSATAIDIGAVMEIIPMLDVGIMARDVGGTDFGVIEFDPRYRIGAAFHLPTMTISADYDLTEIEEGGTAYQEWAMGAEFDIWAIALRTGLSKNAGLSGAPTLLHFGLGLGFLDFGVAYAEKGDYYMAGFNMELGF
jgi:hypothetical protein